MNPVTFVHTVGDLWVEVPGHIGEEPTVTIGWSDIEQALRESAVVPVIRMGMAIQSIQVNDGGLRVRLVQKT